MNCFTSLKLRSAWIPPAVAQGSACLGPVTHAGCGALCPAYDRGCYGCFGPMETPNARALGDRLRALGVPARDIQRLFRSFNAQAGPFTTESERHGG